jgi:polyferredoxin
MILDLLPYKTSSQQKRKNLGWLRVLTFSISLVFVATLFLLQIPGLEHIMFIAFIAGNIIYYAAGITLAFLLKDNRAFCKYLCPITVFLKPMSYFSLIRIKPDETKCVHCDRCSQVCPMEVDVMDPSRNRKNGTECILCLECVKNCPKEALS